MQLQLHINEMELIIICSGVFKYRANTLIQMGEFRNFPISIICALSCVGMCERSSMEFKSRIINNEVYVIFVKCQVKINQYVWRAGEWVGKRGKKRKIL